MKIVSLLLILTLCGCNKVQESKDSTQKRQAAIADEIAAIELTFVKAVLNLNNENAESFVVEAGFLADNLHKISLELDKLGPLPADLRDATLKKLNDPEAMNKLKQSNKTNIVLRPEVAKVTTPAFERFISESTGVEMKAGLVTDAKGNPIELKTTNHP